MGRPSNLFPAPWTVAQWVHGDPADRAPITHVDAAEALARFLRALHEPAPPKAPTNAARGVPLTAAHPADAGFWQVIAEHAGLDRLRQLWKRAPAAADGHGAPLWLHGELHPANVNGQDGRLAEVIDFGEMCAGDPATDLSAAWLILPDGAARRFFDAYGRADQATIDRARGWALLRAVGLIAIGRNGRLRATRRQADLGQLHGFCRRAVLTEAGCAVALLLSTGLARRRVRTYGRTMFDEATYAEDVIGTPVPRASVRAASGLSAGRAAQDAPDVSPAMAALQAAAAAVAGQAPAELPEALALADATALLQVVEQLRGACLTRVADVDARKLHLLDGAGSTSSWVEQQQTSLDRGQVALARRLGFLPMLDEAVRCGDLSIAVAERVGKALSRLRRHVDRPDGLIDGQDGEQALLGVIGHGIRTLLCQAWGGVDDDDPRLTALLAEPAEIVQRPASQLARLEAGFVLLARHLEPAQLPGALGQLVDALLPNELEKRAEDGHANRGFGLRLNDDGSGYRVTDGDLDLECGELLSAVLAAELAVDPDNPVDTAEFEQLRANGWRDGDELPAGSGPRSLRHKRHDALKHALRRYLDTGIAGLRDKLVPHLAVTVSVELLEGRPGALPAVSTSTGARLPASLVRRWVCDSAVGRFVLSLGGRVIEVSHTERTLKPYERRAKRIETGNRCQLAGCRCGPSPLDASRLVPHHPDAYARSGTTSLRDTVWICERCHHDLHAGKKTLRLRDGRWLNEYGWTTGPAG